ncbi:MAG: PAS domain S-box protein [Anaerolineaceae bacterium]
MTSRTPSLALEPQLNVWVASDARSKCPAIDEWIVRAGFTMVEQQGCADIALLPGGLVSEGARYRVAVAQNSGPAAVHALLADGFDDVLVEPLSEGAVMAVLVLADARLARRDRGTISELRAILDASPDMISLSSLDGVISWASAAHEQVLGYTPQEMGGMNGFELIHPSDADRAATALAKLAANEPVTDIELRLRGRNGEWVPVEVGANILPGVNPRLVLVSRAIGDRMDYVRLLRESEERFRTVVDNSPDLVTLVDRDGQIVFANRAHATRLGLDPELLPGRTVSAFIHPDDRTGAREAFFEVFGRSSTMFSARLGHADGRWIPFDIAAAEFTGPSGVPGVVLNSRDETAREAVMAEVARVSTILAVQQENSPDGILVVDEDHQAISFNTRYLEIWNIPAGIAAESLEARTAHVLRQLADPDGVQELLKTVNADPFGTFSAEVRLQDGRCLDMHTSPLLGEAGKNYGRAWYYRDITDRRLAEEALQASEERYRRLVDLSPLAIAVHREGKLVYINDAGARLLGRDRQELVGTQMFEMVHPDDRAAVAAAANTTSASSTTKFVEARLLLRGGEVRHVELASGGVVYDSILSTQTVARDVTDRVVAEEALRQSEKRYRDLLEASPEAIVVLDGDKLAYANPAAARLAGAADAASMIGRPRSDFLDDLPMDAFAERVQRGALGDTFTMVGERLIVKRNVTRQLEISFMATTFDGLPAIRAMLRDVGERLRAEEERLSLERAMLETQKLESLGVMAGGIAHDFNNLLVAIMGNAGLATMELADDSPVQVYLHEIETASQRAADLARQMLAYSGKGHFIVAWANLSELVKEMGNLLRASLPRNVNVRYKLATRLPLIQCDATQIRQVVMNLVINAAEAIGDRDGVVTVTTGEVEVRSAKRANSGELLKPGRHVFLDVQDTGAGMDEANRARIFEPFFTTKFTGRGLGLAAVQGIARGHSGAIRVESEPGVGTTFRLLLPARELPPAELATPVAATAVAVSRGQVLMVDDEESVRRVGEGMLQRLGYDVVACRDCNEALAAVAAPSNAFVAALLDMLVPGAGGGDARQRLRDAGMDCPVVLMSGYNEEHALEGLPPEERAVFLQKPFTLAELSGAIERVTPLPPR